jgi:rubrerythrin
MAGTLQAEIVTELPDLKSSLEMNLKTLQKYLYQNTLPTINSTKIVLDNANAALNNYLEMGGELAESEKSFEECEKPTDITPVENQKIAVAENYQNLFDQLITEERWHDLALLNYFMEEEADEYISDDVILQIPSALVQNTPNLVNDCRIGKSGHRFAWQGESNSQEEKIAELKARLQKAWPLLAELEAQKKFELLRKLVSRFNKRHWDFTRLDLKNICGKEEGKPFRSVRQMINLLYGNE